MMLDMVGRPDSLAPPEHGPGALYRTKHGTFHMLVAINGSRNDRAHVVKFDKDGYPIGTEVYGAAYLDNLTRVGEVPDLLHVVWRS